MEITAELLRDTAEVLKRVEWLTPDQRRANLLNAFGQREILDLVDYTGNLDAFLTNAIARLHQYGDFEPDRPALVVLVESISGNVGTDVQTQIVSLVARLRGAEPQIVTNSVPRASFNNQARRLARPVGGALRLDSTGFVRRDAIIREAVEYLQHDSVADRTLVALKGGRQIGKSTLLAAITAELGAKNVPLRIVYVDFQSLRREEDFASVDMLWQAVARSVATQIGTPDTWQNRWLEIYEPETNVREFLSRHAFAAQDNVPLLVCIDEADRAFRAGLVDFFIQLRSIFNRGANDDIWRKMNWLLCTSTERADLIPPDAGSPFNVGLQIDVNLLTRDEVSEFCRIAGQDDPELPAQLVEFLGGQAYLTHVFLYQLSTGKQKQSLLDTNATAAGIYREHLERLERMLAQKQSAREAMCTVIDKKPVDALAADYLLAYNLVVRNNDGLHAPMCRLYREYFGDRLR